MLPIQLNWCIYFEKGKCYLYNSIGVYTLRKIEIRGSGVINIIDDNVKEKGR